MNPEETGRVKRVFREAVAQATGDAENSEHACNDFYLANTHTERNAVTRDVGILRSKIIMKGGVKMSMENIMPDIDIDRDKSIDLLLASIALEELALAHIVNSEAEKIQFVLGTLHDDEDHDKPTLDELLDINQSVERMLRKVIMKEMLLSFKLEDVVALLEKQDDEHEEDDD